MSESHTNRHDETNLQPSTSHATAHHRHRRPMHGEQQLALVDNAASSDPDDDWVIDSGSRRVGLDAIHQARHLLDEAAQHDAVAAAKRSAELLRRVSAR